MQKHRIILLIFISLLAVSLHASEKTCHGKFVNPITDICWECLFPITIGDVPIVKSHLANTENPKNPICECPGSLLPRIGIHFGFWEPARLADVTIHPYCMVNLGGMQLNLPHQQTKTVNISEEGNHHSFYHVHWYIYPLLYWLNILTDLSCVSHETFDIAYLTELDPTWNDDALSAILHPESALFANLPAQMACAANCVAATAHLPSDNLFWCSGCQGSLYPLDGVVQTPMSFVQSSLLLVERLTYKLHRVGLLWGTSGKEGMCGPYLQTVMSASQYRYQMVNPRYAACYPYGYNTALWESGKQFPITGEDFGYVVWRKRNCCAF